MRILIVYYSYDGNTEMVANLIASQTGADLLRLEPMDEKHRKGFMKYFLGGKQVFRGVKPELKPFSKNPADYDVLFIGTPVWAATYVPAFRTFFDRVQIKGKKVALFCCFGGSKGNTFTNLRQALEGNKIIGEIGFREPKTHDKAEVTAQIKRWVEEMGLK